MGETERDRLVLLRLSLNCGGSVCACVCVCGNDSLCGCVTALGCVKETAVCLIRRRGGVSAG